MENLKRYLHRGVNAREEGSFTEIESKSILCRGKVMYKLFEIERSLVSLGFERRLMWVGDGKQ